MFDGNWDRELLLTLNSFVGNEKPHYVWGLATNILLRSPISFALVSLWFSGESIARRSRMLVGFFAVFVATLLSVWFQFHLSVHTRPFLDPALHLKIADPGFITLGWDRTGSFPSDSATLFFALATVVLLENRLVGLFCFLWVAATIAVPRVAFGWHYPSDIIGALLLGPGFVLLFYKIVPYLRLIAERSLMLFEGRMYLVHAALFIFLAEASDTFENLRHIGKPLLHMLGLAGT